MEVPLPTLFPRIGLAHNIPALPDRLHQLPCARLPTIVVVVVAIVVSYNKQASAWWKMQAKSSTIEEEEEKKKKQKKENPYTCTKSNPREVSGELGGGSTMGVGRALLKKWG